MKKGLSLLFVAFLTSCAAYPLDEDWECEAENGADVTYSGGTSAFVHQRGYGMGGRYKVTKVATDTVCGMTKNEVFFVCKKVNK